jgi:alpha-methylacyl-CoA racemase
VVKTRTRAEWCELLEGSDACFAPVLSPVEAAAHPHNQQRATFTEVAGIVQPAPAPRFSRTRPEISGPAVRPGQNTDEALASWGFSADEVAKLRADGAVR